MGIVQQNIFLVTFMGMCKGMALFSQPFKVLGTWALAVGLVFTFIGSLVTTSFIWASRETWAISINQFFLTWMSLWLEHWCYFPPTAQVVRLHTPMFVVLAFYSHFTLSREVRCEIQ
jgi:hypothetical protein